MALALVSLASWPSPAGAEPYPAPASEAWARLRAAYPALDWRHARRMPKAGDTCFVVLGAEASIELCQRGARAVSLSISSRHGATAASLDKAVRAVPAVLGLQATEPALAGAVAKGYRQSDGPPDKFELVETAPAGSVSATAAE